MLYLLASVACQVACVVHAVRHGRNQMWIMLIIFVPLVGCIAYFVAEVMPGMQGNRHIRTARAKAVAKLDPRREERAARDALDLADTAGNRLRLADALAALGRHAEAIPFYQQAIRMTAGDVEPRTQGKLAASMFEAGEAAEAMALLDAIPVPVGQSERDRQSLLRARIFDHLGRKDEALALYADIVTRMPGEEARCRYAALLLSEGWDNKALKVLEEVESRMNRLDRQQRVADADMYRWATETLRGLRTESGSV